MLGVNSTRPPVRPPCPFQETDTRCGADTAICDDAHTMVRCRKGHLSSVSSVNAHPDDIATLNRSFRLSFSPKRVLVPTTLCLLVIDAIARHL